MEWTLYDISVLIILGYTVSGWLVTLGIKINYGRLKNSITKLQFPPKISWFLFEVANLIWVAYFILIKGDQITLGYFLFIIHYINRDIIYPFFILKSTTKVPLEIILTASSFTFANGYIQGISNQNSGDQNILLQIVGIIVFIVGMYINIKSDTILQAAKVKTGASKYALINQFLFKYVSNPNYFGEIVEWLGYLCICQTFQSFLFLFSTLNILVAAAIPRNKWNIKNIQGYPAYRKACIPFII